MNSVPETEVAFGGIVFDAEGRVLLRKPSGGWGGYAWTFPRGAPEPELELTLARELGQLRQELEAMTRQRDILDIVFGTNRQVTHCGCSGL